MIKILKTKITKPIIAIGGINLDNINKILNAGANGIAVISAISEAKDSAIAVKLLVNSIKRGGNNE